MEKSLIAGSDTTFYREGVLGEIFEPPEAAAHRSTGPFLFLRERRQAGVFGEAAYLPLNGPNRLETQPALNPYAMYTLHI